MKDSLIDRYGRKINYLRISVTDQCNLRCLYCQPHGLVNKLPHQELLSYEEIYTIVRIAIEMGVRKIRVTGGEPLVRRDVIGLLAQIASVPELQELRVTTNGVLLKEMAKPLREAGVSKLNVSLDTLQAKRFKEITGRDLFRQVWDGINTSQEMGFTRVKLNVVAMKGVNDDEFLEFARLTENTSLQIRFIEYMPIGLDSRWEKGKYISCNEIKRIIEPLGGLVPINDEKMAGPAKLYRIAGYRGEIGFISPLSHQFCSGCNRLRLTSEGKLRSCLLADKETNLKKTMRSGASEDEIRSLLADTIRNKPMGHTLSRQQNASCNGEMSKIGG